MSVQRVHATAHRLITTGTLFLFALTAEKAYVGRERMDGGTRDDVARTRARRKDERKTEPAHFSPRHFAVHREQHTTLSTTQYRQNRDVRVRFVRVHGVACAHALLTKRYRAQEE